ncbi:MAG: glycosyltransferase [bacterium]|nr:glycosyltransferase [bacterium]
MVWDEEARKREYFMKIRNAVCYSFSLNNTGADAMGSLRIGAPFQQAGIRIVYGVENGEVFPERVSEGDIVVFQRELPGKFAEYQKIVEAARRERKPIVFDLDDLLFFLPENHPDRLARYYTPSLLPMFQALTEVDLVTVATQALKDVVSNYNKNVVVLPNYFDDDLWRLKPPLPKDSSHEMLTIGYMGTDSHGPDLDYITPVLLDLIKRYPHKIRFHFWGMQPPAEMLSYPQVKWTPHYPYSYKDFSAFFQTQSADIFIAPLVDNLFNRCKSPLKFFEYSALGAPGVFSHLETYSDAVSHGKNGLLASSPDEWTDCLIQLIENDELRFQLATRAQAAIRKNWLLSQNAFRWEETFQRAFNIPSSNREQNSRIVNITKSINLQLFESFNKKDATVQTLTAQVASLTAQVSEREQTVASLTAQVSEREQTVASLTAHVAEIYSSTTWRLMQALLKIQTVIAPHGSRRERWLRLGVRTAIYLKRFGVRSLTRQSVEKLKHKDAKSVVNPQPAPFAITAQDGMPCPMPAISVVIEKNPGLNLPSVGESDVLTWVSGQTLREIEVVVWNSDTGTAVTLGEPLRAWDAPVLDELCRGLAGRYLCMASPDLLQRNRAYLETNLIALESEGLAFTVNALGKPDWLLAPLRSSHLPGDRMLPYLRQVIRRDCARNDFSLDITGRLIERPDMPSVAGKIIVHTTAFPDTDHPFPTETLLAKTVEWRLTGNYILARSNSQIPWVPLEHVVHPVNTVIPVLPESSNLPTIIIFMPFLAVGGAERLALQLIRHLQDQVRFVVVTVEGMDAALGTTADAFHQTVPFVYTAADYLLPPLNFSFLGYLIERFQADTLYIANGSNWIYDALGALRQHYPGLRIVDQVYDHQFGWINRYDPTVAAAMDAHISANPNITLAYTNRGIRPERIHFVEHAINMEDINPADYPVERCLQIKQKLGLPLEKKLVTFCARLHPQKRPLDFIELARRFAGEENIHFLMVGDGSLTSAVEEQIARTGLKNFTRHKFYTPIADIYAVTDVMVLPSEYEAMPLVILETLAMGKPVVATDVGHIRDVVEMTHAGVVVPNIGDVAALRMGVLQALGEPVDSAAMRQIIDQRFGVSHIARQYLQVWLGEDHA